MGRSNTWQVDEVTNAIEREGEELRDLQSQLTALLEESKARAREEEVGEMFFQQTKLIEIKGGGDLAEVAGATGGHTADTSHFLPPTRSGGFTFLSALAHSSAQI